MLFQNLAIVPGMRSKAIEEVAKEQLPSGFAYEFLWSDT